MSGSGDTHSSYGYTHTIIKIYYEIQILDIFVCGWNGRYGMCGGNGLPGRDR